MIAMLRRKQIMQISKQSMQMAWNVSALRRSSVHSGMRERQSCGDWKNQHVVRKNLSERHCDMRQSYVLRRS